MNTAKRLITFAVLAAMGLASAQSPAQQRDRRSRDRDRDDERERTSTTWPASTQPQQASSSSGTSYSDRYAVLEQRNVFVRDRSRATSRNSSPGATQPSRRSAEESLIVRGIAMEDGGFRAYVEDLNSSTTLRVAPGDSLARGHVVLIALDAIAYEHDGKQTWIEIGSDLTGRMMATPSYASSGATPTTGPTSLPANLDPNDPSLTVEQRMRIRRMQAEQRR